LRLSRRESAVVEAEVVSSGNSTFFPVTDESRVDEGVIDSEVDSWGEVEDDEFTAGAAGVEFGGEAGAEAEFERFGAG